MSGLLNSRINIRGFIAALVYIFVLSLATINYVNPFITSQANALDVDNRSISLGSSFASEVTEHTFRFDLAGNSTVSSISFQYCTNSPLLNDPCTPSDVDVSGFALGAESGITGFSVSGSTTPNNAIITRAAAVETPISNSYRLDNIQNPSTSNTIVYVRIGLWDGPDATGSRVDEGAVVFVTEDEYFVTAYVPPYLTFCVAVTVALDCTSTSGFLADFGEFSESIATAVTSQFAVATNDGTGYNTFINGQTMTSGTNIIPALLVQSASLPGSSQFGINLRSNTNPSAGANIQSGPVGNGQVDPNYNIVNQFRFVNGDRMAYSTRSSGFNRYTASYIVNIAGSQAPGVYATTFTYTSIASF